MCKGINISYNNITKNKKPVEEYVVHNKLFGNANDILVDAYGNIYLENFYRNTLKIMNGMAGLRFTV